MFQFHHAMHITITTILTILINAFQNMPAHVETVNMYPNEMDVMFADMF
jgi:hypothetical protein